MNQTDKTIDLWAMVELMGHSKIAGHITEENIAGANMLRVDVPETAKNIAFTKWYNGSAIYAINPVDEQTARHFAEQFQQAPINSWDLSAMQEKLTKIKALQAADHNMETDGEKDEEDYEDPEDWK